MQEPQASPLAAELWKSSDENERWRDIVFKALAYLGGTASLPFIYEIVSEHPRTKSRAHWKAQVRLRLESDDAFVRVSKGVWGFAKDRSSEEVARLNAIRAEECPKRPRVKKT
jgi:hypothetical protein